jgi:hypothetical protein
MTQGNKITSLLDKIRQIARKGQNAKELAKLYDKLQKNESALVSFEEGQVKVLN